MCTSFIRLRTQMHACIFSLSLPHTHKLATRMYNFLTFSYPHYESRHLLSSSCSPTPLLYAANTHTHWKCCIVSPISPTPHHKRKGVLLLSCMCANSSIFHSGAHTDPLSLSFSLALSRSGSLLHAQTSNKHVSYWHTSTHIYSHIRATYGTCVQNSTHQQEGQYMIVYDMWI